MASLAIAVDKVIKDPLDDTERTTIFRACAETPDDSGIVPKPFGFRPNLAQKTKNDDQHF